MHCYVSTVYRAALKYVVQTYAVSFPYQYIQAALKAQVQEYTRERDNARQVEKQREEAEKAGEMERRRVATKEVERFRARVRTYTYTCRVQNIKPILIGHYGIWIIHY